MNFAKVGMSSLLSSLVEIIVGILLLVNPIGFTSGILIAFGIVLCIMGLAKIVRYFRTDPEEAAHEGNLAVGIGCILAGLVCALKTQWIIVTFPMITMVYGIVSLLSGISKLQISIDLVRQKRKYWFVALISSILTLICSVFIIANPFASTAALWMFIGITLIVEAVVDLITYIFSKKGE